MSQARAAAHAGRPVGEEGVEARAASQHGRRTPCRPRSDAHAPASSTQSPTRTPDPRRRAGGGEDAVGQVVRCRRGGRRGGRARWWSTQVSSMRMPRADSSVDGVGDAAAAVGREGRAHAGRCPRGPGPRRSRPVARRRARPAAPRRVRCLGGRRAAADATSTLSSPCFSSGWPCDGVGAAHGVVQPAGQLERQAARRPRREEGRELLLVRPCPGRRWRRCGTSRRTRPPSRPAAAMSSRARAWSGAARHLDARAARRQSGRAVEVAPRRRTSPSSTAATSPGGSSRSRWTAAVGGRVAAGVHDEPTR